MKAITLTQPWASLVAVGAKQIETRSWRTSYRGEIAIHAAKTFPGSAKSFCDSRLVYRAFGWPECPRPLTQEWLDDNSRRIKSLPLGCVLGTIRIVDCVPTEQVRASLSQPEEAFGDYSPGRFAWLLEDFRPLPEPAPCKGALSLWEWAGSSLLSGDVTFSVPQC